MKKAKILSAIISLTLIFAFAACSSAPAKEINPAEAAQTIAQKVTFKDSLLEAPKDVVKNYYSVDDTIADYAVYMSGSGATAEEVAVIKATDAQGVKKAKEIINERVELLKVMFKDYRPDEMKKLESPVIVEVGNTVILVLCDDAAQAQKVIAELK